MHVKSIPESYMVILMKVEQNDDMTCGHGRKSGILKEMFFNRRGTVVMRATTSCTWSRMGVPFICKTEREGFELGDQGKLT